MAVTKESLLKIEEVAILLDTTPAGVRRMGLDFVSDGRITRASVNKALSAKLRVEQERVRCRDVRGVDFSAFKVANAASPKSGSRKTERRVHVFPLTRDCNDSPTGIVLSPAQWHALRAFISGSGRPGVSLDGSEFTQSQAKAIREVLEPLAALYELLLTGRGLHVEWRQAT